MTPEELAAQAQEQADFEDGFSGDELPVVTDPEPVVADADPEPADPEPVVADDPEPAEPEPADPMADAITELTSQVRTLNSRYGSLSDKVTRMGDTAKAAATVQGAASPTAAQAKAAFSDGEKFKALHQEFPEWGNAMEEMANTLRSELSVNAPQVDMTEINQLLASVQEDQKSSREREQANILTSHHRDWLKDINTAKFKEWNAKQTPEVQALANSENPFDAVDMLDKYKADTKKKVVKQEQNVEKLKNAVPATHGRKSLSRRSTTTSEQDDFEEGFASG